MLVEPLCKPPTYSILVVYFVVLVSSKHSWLNSQCVKLFSSVQLVNNSAGSEVTHYYTRNINVYGITTRSIQYSKQFLPITTTGEPPLKITYCVPITFNYYFFIYILNMYKEGSNVDSKFDKNKFESSISELKKKSFVSAADIDSYGKLSVSDHKLYNTINNLSEDS